MIVDSAVLEAARELERTTVEVNQSEIALEEARERFDKACERSKAADAAHAKATKRLLTASQGLPQSSFIPSELEGK